VDNDDAHHAVANPLVVADMGDDDSPLRTLVLGPDRSGNMLEVIVLLRRRSRDGHPRADASPVPRVAPATTGGQTMTNKKTNPVIGTSRGKRINDADIERLADEAEAGYDITTLRTRGGRPPMGSGPAEVVPVRLDPELRAAVEARATADDTTTSEIIREALRHFLHVA
jgi:Ribbon-helix-helix protein, copG family